MLIIGDYRSGEKISMFHLITRQPDIDKNYLYAEDPYKAKWKSTGLKHFNDSKAFIEYSNDMHDIYKNIE